MKLSAVVIVAGTAGCVCEVQPGTGKVPAAAGAAVSAAVVLAAQAAAANQVVQQNAAQKH
ncbi:MAG: hypothetical protein ACM3PC_12510 [Deltaproteobacteria bacterium]